MKKILFVGLMCLAALTMVQCSKDVPEGYVDLGLPSGTIWKAENEDGLMDYTTAKERYGDQLPTEAQFTELIDKCDWKWTGSGYRVFGPNNQFINIRANGFIDCNGTSYFDASGGYYWSSTSVDGAYPRYLSFVSNDIFVAGHPKCSKHSIRLVKGK